MWEDGAGEFAPAEISSQDIFTNVWRCIFIFILYFIFLFNLGVRSLLFVGHQRVGGDGDHMHVLSVLSEAGGRRVVL